MKKHVILLLGLATMLMIGVSLQAREKVAVIPMSVSKSLSNIVTVAKSGGDFTDPQKAIDSITDASEDNPYLVVIAPGIYEIEQTLEMKPYVSITGSGQYETHLWGKIGTSSIKTSAIINGTQNATFSNIALQNLGNKDSKVKFAIGIYCHDANMTLENVRVLTAAPVHGADFIRAFYGLGGSTLRLNDVELYAYGPGATAFYNGEESTAHFNNVTTETRGVNSRGLYNSNNSISHVNSSRLSGKHLGLKIGSSETRIRNTIIEGGVEDTASTLQCVNTYDPNFNSIDC